MPVHREISFDLKNCIDENWGKGGSGADAAICKLTDVLMAAESEGGCSLFAVFFLKWRAGFDERASKRARPAQNSAQTNTSFGTVSRGDAAATSLHKKVIGVKS